MGSKQHSARSASLCAAHCSLTANRSQPKAECDQLKASALRFDLVGELFDDGIGEKFACDALDLSARLVRIQRVGEAGAVLDPRPFANAQDGWGGNAVGCEASRMCIGSVLGRDS